MGVKEFGKIIDYFKLFVGFRSLQGSDEGLDIACRNPVEVDKEIDMCFCMRWGSIPCFGWRQLSEFGNGSWFKRFDNDFCHGLVNEERGEVLEGLAEL